MTSRTIHTGTRRGVLRGALGTLLAAALVVPVACSAPAGDPMAEIRSLQESGAFEDSIEPLREVLAAEPDHAEANLLLGTALTQIGEPANAVFSLRRAAQDPEFGAQAGLLMASNLLQTHNLERAAEAAEDVTKLEPELLPGWILLAATHQRIRDWEAMLAAAEKAVALEPRHLQARGLHGVALYELDRFDEAVEVLASIETETREAGDVISAANACTSIAGAELKKTQPETEDESEALARALADADDPRARLELRNSENPRAETVASDAAEAAYRRCFDEYPTVEAAISELADYYEETGSPERSREVWGEATSRSPEVMAFRLGEATFVWEQGDHEEAKKLMALAADDFQTPQAYEELARLHRLDDEFSEAAEALSVASDLGGGSDRLRFQRAELFATSGEIERAEQLLAEVEEESYRKLIEARIAMQREQYEEALSLYDAALKGWPDNSGARFLAGVAAFRLGLFERALVEYRESIRAEPDENPACLAGAQLASALGKHALALTYVNLHLNGSTYNGPEAHLAGARAAVALGKLELADEYLTGLAEFPGGAPYAAAERAAQISARAGADAAAKFLGALSIDWADGENLPVLRALVQAHIDRGTPLEALDPVRAAVAADASSVDLLDLEGRVLVAADRDAEARAVFEKAIALDPEAPNPHEGLGVLAFRAQDLDTAIRELDRAVELEPDHEEAAYRAAQLVLVQGDVDGAKARLRKVVETHPAAARARNDLAYLLADGGGDLDEALALAQAAARTEAAPDIADTLAFVHLKRGEVEAAIATLEKALARTPEVPTLRYRLGEALAQKGEVEAAQSAIREALRFGAFPEAEQAKAMLVQLETAGTVAN
ncbi:MAG: tetratricopeptide repeat protein [Myxococcota bacterium]|nr:tetratricopeptide repeat protein [Myxococcota bacterium]